MSIRKYGHRAFLVACLGLAGCATAGRSPEPVTAPALSEAALLAVERGQEALAAEDFERASTLFQRVLRETPENPRARLGLAESYLGLGVYEEALRIFRELGENPEVGIQALQGKGIVLLLKGDSRNAYEALSEVVAERPRMWRAWNAIGRYHDIHENWQGAAEAYRNALAAAPATAAAMIHNNWGMSAMAQRRYGEAVARFNEAIERDRSFRVAKSNLRLALAFQGRYAEAMSGVTDMERPTALNNVGFVAMMRGDHARAEAYFLRALESSPTFHNIAAKNRQLLTSLKRVRAPGKQRASDEERAE